MPERFQVVIVGGGPVGVALAVDLGQRGIRCAIVERHLTPVRIPKGQNLTNRSMEHLFFWNCEPELREARVMPRGYPIGGVTAYGNLLSDYWWSQGGVQSSATGRGNAVAPYFYKTNERLPQYCTEEVLRGRMQALPSVTQLFGWTADAVESDDNGVRVTISPANEGASFYSWSSDTEQQTSHAPSSSDAQVLEANYVVGCDGGRSLVRESMGIEREGRDFDQRMVLAVLRSKELHEILKRFPEGTTYRVLKPELQGYWQFFGRVDVGEGFFFHAPVPRDTQPDNYDFHALLEEAVGTKFNAELDHVGFWDLRVMVASQYSKGRVFIAGDSAHQHPPYGGFGLNTGLEDATNLGWKLAGRLNGWAGEGLLDSYSQERRPIFVETGEAMIAGGIDRDRDFLNAYNLEKDKAEFEAKWAEWGSSGGNRQQSYEPHYEGSSVIDGPAGGVCSIHGAYSHAAQAGHHLSPRALSGGRNVYEELLGAEYVLLSFGADAAAGAIQDAAKSLDVPLKLVSDSYEGERQDYGSKLILVRPDQYVVWAGNEAPADARALIKKAAGLK